MRAVLALSVALAAAQLSCQKETKWYGATSPAGWVFWHADTPAPADVIAGYDAAVERAIAHVLRYERADVAGLWAALHSVTVYVLPGRDERIGKWSPTLQRYPSGSTDLLSYIALAWRIPESTVEAAAFGHELGHVWATRVYGYNLGAVFEHSWRPPLKSAAVAGIYGAEDCGCGR